MEQPDNAFATAFWGEAMAEEEPLRERRFPLVDVQTAITWRVLEPLLAGGPTVLDAGAGTGRYSLELARRGHRVTHLDISTAMLRRAMATAAREGLDTITFVQGDVKDLSALPARGHDLTLCLDAPLSYAYPHQEQALAEVCRVTGDTLVLMVSSRSGVLPFFIDLDLAGEFIPPDHADITDPLLMSRAIWEGGVERFPPAIRDYLAGAGKLTPPDYAFTPEELTGLLESGGFQVETLAGPGALARSIKPETLAKIQGDQAVYEQFIEMSMAFDFNVHNLGLGGVNLLAVARRRHGAGRSGPKRRGRSRRAGRTP